MSLDASNIVSLVGALGLGSVLGQWLTGSKDRKTARASVLIELAGVEEARWHKHGADKDSAALLAATKRLETAALVGRVPRSAVLPYVQLATASLWSLQEGIEEGLGEPEYVYISPEMSDAVLEAAEIVSRAVWSSPAKRWMWLHRRLRALERSLEAITDPTTRRKIDQARKYVR